MINAKYQKATISKQVIYIVLLFSVLLASCNLDTVKIKPLEHLASVDRLLSNISEGPQKLLATSQESTLVFGKKGTVIHLDPSKLETIDGSPFGDQIEIELLEMTKSQDMLLNNAPTTSNGRLLVTGGAYYLNMTSDGKQLKMKEGQGLDVEFPKLSNEEMGLFLGERDSLGQVNWIPAQEKFVSKEIEDAKEPKLRTSETEVKTSTNETDILIDYLGSGDGAAEELSPEEYQDYLLEKARYEKRQKEIERERRTYEAVELLNFGWINCDRFYNEIAPKTSITLKVQNDSLQGARFFAIFKDINSMMSTWYWKDGQDTTAFRNVPEGRAVYIIGLSARDSVPYFFETQINTSDQKNVEINFKESTHDAMRTWLERVN